MTGIGVRVERLHCPLSSCEWAHERTPPDEVTHTLTDGESPFHNGPAATLDEAIADAVYATMLAEAQAVESVLRAHLETHGLVEWVQEVMRPRMELNQAVSGGDCGHTRLEYLDPEQLRGWLCVACGRSGPTVVQCITRSEEAMPFPAGLRATCVCGHGQQWPPPETGLAVAAWLAEHAGCDRPSVLEAGDGAL